MFDFLNLRWLGHDIGWYSLVVSFGFALGYGFRWWSTRKASA